MDACPVSVESFEDVDADLAASRRIHARREVLRARVAAFEAKFNLQSADLYAALDEGLLVETEEVCDWIIAYEVLQRPVA